MRSPDLAVLAQALDESDADLALLLQRLGDSCALAVGSYLGFSITLVVGEVPVSFSVLEEFLDPCEVLTSVMFPLSALGEHATASQVILYAGTVGAFVDLAADLSYVLGSGPDTVQLDRHVTPLELGHAAASLTRMSRQNQAIGILLDQGHDVDEALLKLRRRAGRDGISVHTAAQQLIDPVCGRRRAIWLVEHHCRKQA